MYHRYHFKYFQNINNKVFYTISHSLFDEAFLSFVLLFMIEVFSVGSATETTTALIPYLLELPATLIVVSQVLSFVFGLSFVLC